MYFITVFETIVLNDMKCVEFGDQRTCGYYIQREQAIKALHENGADMCGSYFHYAVIEKIGPGIYAHCKERQWFRWDWENREYVEIDEPKCVKRLTDNFAIG